MMTKNSSNPIYGMIAYVLKHPVLANLLILLALITGLASAYRMNRQFFPDFAIDTAVVSVV